MQQQAPRRGSDVAERIQCSRGHDLELAQAHPAHLREAGLHGGAQALIGLADATQGQKEQQAEEHHQRNRLQQALLGNVPPLALQGGLDRGSQRFSVGLGREAAEAHVRRSDAKDLVPVDPQGELTSGFVRTGRRDRVQGDLRGGVGILNELREQGLGGLGAFVGARGPVGRRDIEDPLASDGHRDWPGRGERGRAGAEGQRGNDEQGGHGVVSAQT